MGDDFNRYLKRATTVGFTIGTILVSILFVGISYFTWGESQDRQARPWLQIFPQNVLSHLVDSDYHPISGKIRLIQETKLFDQFAIYDSNGDWIDGFGVTHTKPLIKSQAKPIKDESGNVWGWFTYNKNSSEKYIYLKLIISSTLFLVLSVIVLIQFIFNKFVATKVARFSDLIASIDVISNRIKSNPDHEIFKDDLADLNNLEFKEAKLLQASILNLINEIETSKQMHFASMVESEKNRSLSEIATQVAHDVRSPLEVLKSLKEELSGLPESSRKRVQLSINRIEEITFNLLRSHKQNSGLENKLKPEELLSLVSSVVTEKKIEFRKLPNLEIEQNFTDHSYGLFSNVQRSALKSILSNLINNAADSVSDKSGLISIYLESDGIHNIIKISDNGAGIPAEVQKSIFSKGFTTKQSGNGLGLFSAKQDIEAAGGTISYDSQVSQGTTFSIILPKSEIPSTFVSSINVHDYDKIIVLDDDPAFHEVWSKRLVGIEDKIEHIHSVEVMLQRYKTLDSKTLLLSDFELMDKAYDGIDTILKLRHASNSILVTARNEELAIQERCLQDGIRLLPKSLVNYVKVESLMLEASQDNLIVLIDDDRLVRLNWANYCEKKNLPFKIFPSIDAFLKVSASIHKSSIIYVDSNLGEGVFGELDSEKIFKLGFSNLYIVTGYEKDSIKKHDWIKGIFSKSPQVITDLAAL